jgi:hypothetical protein
VAGLNPYAKREVGTTRLMTNTMPTALGIKMIQFSG